MKYTFFTDSHLTGQNPEERCDDFADAILAKIEQVYSHSKKVKAEFVLFGGDLCNTHKIYSYFILERFISILKMYKIPTYFVVGQHDLYGYEETSYKDSALRFMEKMSDGLFIKLEKATIIKSDVDCCLYPCHVYDDIHKKALEIPDDGKFNILIAHELLSSKKRIFTTLPIEEITTKANIVLSGDLHDGVPYCTCNGVSFYNSGALARIKCDDVDRDIKMGVFEVVCASGKYEILFSDHMIDCKPAKEVFYVQKKEYKSEFTGFAEQIDTIEKTAVDIFDLITLWLESNKGKIRNDLVSYILKFRKNA